MNESMYLLVFFFEHGVFAVKVTILFVVAIVLQRKESLEEKQIMQVV